MDPKIWGSKLWNIMYDICWLLEQKSTKLSPCTKTSIKVFFQSLRYLLPCFYCRESYCIYLRHLKGSPPLGKGALKWIFDLKNMVNNKLKKKDELTYECFVRRMKTWSSASSINDLWDILGVFAVNFPAKSKDVTLHQKQSSLHLLMYVLPDILYHLPNRRGQAEVLKMKRPTKEDVKCREKLLKYICCRANALDKGRRCPEQIMKQYVHCRAPNKK